VNGGPAGGRNFFLAESDPGFASSLNQAFGPPRQTISLRLKLSGDARDARTAAQDRLIGEGILLGATILTPTPLDDMAAAGLRGGARILRGGPRVVAAGKEGEAAVRAVVDIGEKKPYKINGRTRIPDGIKGNILSEVKNVNKLSYTRQLRDYAAIAKREGLEFHLYVRRGAHLSERLNQEILKEDIKLRYIP
jgi:Restriction endonuclease fold toxin 7